MKHFRVMTKPDFPATQIWGNIATVSSCQPSGAGAAADRRHLMRPFSLILAAILLIGGSSLAGSSESGLPGVGTFAYAGSTTTASAAQIAVLAER
jgi:hypothetical protein